MWNFPFLRKISKVFQNFKLSLINHLVWRAKKCRFIWSSERLEPELRDRFSWEKLVTVADLKGHPREKFGSSQIFFWWISEIRWWIIKGIKISVTPLWQGEIFDLKFVKYLDESKRLKTQSFICLCWLTRRELNWLILTSHIN